MSFSEENLIWLDLEMTGLDTEKDLILEIATIVTNRNLQIIAEGPVFAIHQSDEVLNNMSGWCQLHHGQSGLTERVRKSIVTEAHAETETLKFLENYVPRGKSPLCGNSICQDRRFLHRYMPTLEAYFHYQHLDVSTVKLLAQYWSPTVSAGFTKQNQHLALADIRESIAELRHYREHLLK